MEPWKLWSLQTRNYIMVQVSEPFFYDNRRNSRVLIG